jgi:cell wall-associated NlpC family hydrolase
LFTTKFVDGGRDVKTGLDCQGLMLAVMKLYGHDVKDTDTAIYATEVVSQLINNELASGKWEKVDSPEEGCVVVLAIDSFHPNVAQHLGVYVGEGKFLHILEKIGVCTTSIEHRFFKNKIKGYYRWKG